MLSFQAWTVVADLTLKLIKCRVSLKTVLGKLCRPRLESTSNEPRQANLVLIAYASSEGSGEPAHPRSLARTFAARSYKQWVKRNLQTESQIPGPSEWQGMRSWNLSWRNARRHKFAWRGSNKNVCKKVTSNMMLMFSLYNLWKVSRCKPNLKHHRELIFCSLPYHHSHLTSFGKKYGHFSFLCKQMNIFLRNVYSFRKVTSVLTFWFNPILVHVTYIAHDE